MSSFMESAGSAIETRMSSSSLGMGRISETTSSHETAIAGGITRDLNIEHRIAGGTRDLNVESRTAKITLDADDGKPVFIKTIEGCNIERKYATLKSPCQLTII